MKRFNIIAVALTCLALSACGDSWAQAVNKACKGHDGVNRTEEKTAYCRDGTAVEVDY